MLLCQIVAHIKITLPKTPSYYYLTAKFLGRPPRLTYDGQKNRSFLDTCWDKKKNP